MQPFRNRPETGSDKNLQGLASIPTPICPLLKKLAGHFEVYGYDDTNRHDFLNSRIDGSPAPSQGRPGREGADVTIPGMRDEDVVEQLLGTERARWRRSATHFASTLFETGKVDDPIPRTATALRAIT